LPSGCSLWHFLDCYYLMVFIDTITIFSGEWIIVLIFGGEGIALSLNSLLILSHLLQIVLVIVLLDHTSFGDFTVMDWRLYGWLDDTHFSDNSLDWDKLVDQVSLQASGSDKVLTKVAFKVDIVALDLLREVNVSADSHLLAIKLPIVLLHPLYCWVQLVFKDLDSVNWVLEHKVCESRIELPQFINVHTESWLILTHHPLQSLGDFIVIQELLSQLLQLLFLCVSVEGLIGRGQPIVVVSRGVDLHYDYRNSIAQFNSI
jgi:hypothetical protein